MSTETLPKHQPTTPKRRLSEHYKTIYQKILKTPDDEPIRFENIIIDLPCDLVDLVDLVEKYPELSKWIEVGNKLSPPPYTYGNGINNIDEIKFVKDLYISNCVFTVYVNLTNVHFLRKLHIGHSRFEKEVRFESCTFHGETKIIDAVFNEEAYFSGSTFETNVDFSTTKFLKYTRFNSNGFLNRTSFMDTTYYEGGLFEENVFKNDTLFNATYYGRDARFSDNEFFKGVDFRYSRFWGKACFEYSKFSSAETFVSAEFNEDLEFTGIDFDGNTFLNEIKSQKNINFRNVNISGNVDLMPKTAKKILFDNSKISGILTLDLKEENWETIEFKDTFVNEGSLKLRPRKIKLEKIEGYETARLFKHIMTSEHDGINALHYKACEMELYRQKAKISCFERILLTLNRISNNHGESWIQGLGCLLIVWSVFFSIMALAQYGSGTIFIWTDGESLRQAVEYLWIPNMSLSPLGKDVAWYVLLLSIIGKILMGYCVYQTIAAFRKHGKP